MVAVIHHGEQFLGYRDIELQRACPVDGHDGPVIQQEARLCGKDTVFIGGGGVARRFPEFHQHPIHHIGIGNGSYAFGARIIPWGNAVRLVQGEIVTCVERGAHLGTRKRSFQEILHINRNALRRK